jgi:hypothetical protein
MRLTILPSETIINTGFNIKVTYDYTDIDDGGAATTTTLQILPEPGTTGTCPVGTAVWRAAHRLVTAVDFSDAGITSCLFEVGDGGDPNRFLGQVETAADGSYVSYTASAVTTFPYAYTTADTIDAKWTVANGGTPLVNEATSGAGEIYLFVTQLSTLNAV